MEVREIDISSTRVSELNVRKDFEAGTEDTDIGDLAKSIADQGIFSPIIVIPVGYMRGFLQTPITVLHQI